MKKALIIVLICIAVIAAGGYGAYKLYVVPKYIEPAMEKAADVINSDETKEKVDELVSELVERGALTEEDAEKYYSKKTDQNDPASDTSQEASSDASGSAQTEDAPQSEPEKTDGGAAKKADIDEQQKSGKETSVYDKVMSEVSPEDAQELYSLYSQYSSLAGMSTEEIKRYAKENMSPEEIRRALDLYSKYSGLLN